MSYKTEQAIILYNMAFAWELSGYHLLRDSEAVIRDCNGIGAAWMPDSMRKLCTDLFPVMEVPAAIHDRRYSIGTSASDRKIADDEFLDNCNIVIDYECAWWNPMRYIYRKRAKEFYALLRTFGGIAFNNKEC